MTQPPFRHDVVVRDIEMGFGSMVFFMVHGDPDRQAVLMQAFETAGYRDSIAPERGESFEL